MSVYKTIGPLAQNGLAAHGNSKLAALSLGELIAALIMLIKSIWKFAAIFM